MHPPDSTQTPILPTPLDDAKRDASSASFCLVEVPLPMAVTHAWVSYACRAAMLTKPRWSATARVWTATARTGETLEKVTIATSTDRLSLRVTTEHESGPLERESTTARRVITAFVTGMQWAVARRAGHTRAL